MTGAEGFPRTGGAAALFDFVRHGWIGSQVDERASGLLKALFRFTFGGGGGQCVARLAALGRID